MAMCAQALHKRVAVDAGDRRLAGRIDIGATITASASLKQVQNSSNKACSRV
jgi:hypothetical protein